MSSERRIYFGAAIAAGRDDALTYSQIIRHLRAYGEVLTPQFGDLTMGTRGETLPPEMIHDRDLDWLRSCDVFVCEVTTPSLGVGYQIGKASEWGKPILCLHREGERPLSKMIVGSRSLVVAPYRITPQIPGILTSFFTALAEIEAEPAEPASES